MIRSPFEDPIPLSATNTFSVEGRLQRGVVIGRSPKVRVTGSVSGSQVTLTLPAIGLDPAVTYVLQAGLTPDPIEEPTLPPIGHPEIQWI